MSRRSWRRRLPTRSAALVGHAPTVEGLVPLIDAGLEGDTPWLAMEHLACPTLDMRLREGGLLPLEEATGLGPRFLADAVDTAHAHGLDHGSLHPRDVFLPPDGGVIGQRIRDCRRHRRSWSAPAAAPPVHRARNAGAGGTRSTRWPIATRSA